MTISIVIFPLYGELSRVGRGDRDRDYRSWMLEGGYGVVEDTIVECIGAVLLFVIAGEKAVGRGQFNGCARWRGGSYGLCVRVCTGWRCPALARVDLGIEMGTPSLPR